MASSDNRARVINFLTSLRYIGIVGPLGILTESYLLD